MRPDVLQLRSSAGLYGADQALLALSSALPAAGISNRMLCIENYQMERQFLHDRALALGLDACLLPCHGRFDVGTLRGLQDQLRAAPGAVLHVHDYKSAFYAWLATRRSPHTSLVATLHGWVETSGALRFYKRLELTLLHRFDRLIIVADAQRETLRRAGIAPDRIQAIANGVDTARFTPTGIPAARSEFGLPASAFLFGSVARLAPEKNLDALIGAIATLRREGADVALLLAGDGPERATLEASVEAAGLSDRVRFAGAREDTCRIYPMLDCFVLPSLTEGMPLAVLEAMACARPVVASAVGDVPRLLASSDLGRLVPPGDTPALVAALREASNRRGIDKAARRHAETQHSVTAMAAQYAELYRGLQEAAHGHATA